MDEQGYNGWMNYETWCMALWIDNERGSYEESREMAHEARAWAREDVDLGDSFIRTAQGRLADHLQTAFGETPDLGASVWADLLAAALGEVDWYEIAENYLSELADA